MRSCNLERSYLFILSTKVGLLFGMLGGPKLKKMMKGKFEKL